MDNTAWILTEGQQNQTGEQDFDTTQLHILNHTNDEKLWLHLIACVEIDIRI